MQSKQVSLAPPPCSALPPPAERQRTPASEGGPFNMFDIAQGKPLDQPGAKKEVRHVWGGAGADVVVDSALVSLHLVAAAAPHLPAYRLATLQHAIAHLVCCRP